MMCVEHVLSVENYDVCVEHVLSVENYDVCVCGACAVCGEL